MHRLRAAGVAANDRRRQRSDASQLARRVVGVERDPDRARLADAYCAVVGDDADNNNVHARCHPIARHSIATLNVGKVYRPTGDAFDSHACHS